MSNRVRVSIPVSVASEIGSFKKAVGSVLEQLGCPACCSGHDIQFELQRSVSFNESLEVSDTNLLGHRFLSSTSPQSVSASMAPDMVDNLEGVHKAIDRIAATLACPACCSGHDLSLSQERTLVLNDKLDVLEKAVSIDF